LCGWEIEGAQSGRGQLAQKCPKWGRAQWQSIAQTAAAMERHWGREGCRFMTETLPGDTSTACGVYAAWSSYRVALLGSAIKNAVPNHPGVLLHCWEIQDRGALHLHCAVAGDAIFLDWWDSNCRRLCWSHLLRIEQKVNLPGVLRERPGRLLTRQEIWQF